MKSEWPFAFVFGQRTTFSSLLIVAAAVFVSDLSAKDGLQIDKAYCGAQGSWRDVTAFLQGELKGDTLSVNIAQPFEEIGGDPAFGRGKNLIIDYRLNGQSFRLLLEEQYPIAFTIGLPSSEAVAPGADPRASAIMADIAAHPALEVAKASPVTTRPTVAPFRNGHGWALIFAVLLLLALGAAAVIGVVLFIFRAKQNKTSAPPPQAPPVLPEDGR